MSPYAYCSNSPNVLIDPSGFGGHRVVHHTENGDWTTMEPDEEPMPSGAGYGYEGGDANGFGGGGGRVQRPTVRQLIRFVRKYAAATRDIVVGEAKKAAVDALIGVGVAVAEEGGGHPTDYRGGWAYWAGKASTHFMFMLGSAAGTVLAGGGSVGGYALSPTTLGTSAAVGTGSAILAGALAVKTAHSATLVYRTVQGALQSPQAGNGGGGGGGVQPDKFSRDPKGLLDQMTLEGAKQGKGMRIIESLKDPKFKGMEKWSYSVKSANGLHSEVHYVRNPKTGELMDFKFKIHASTYR